MGRGTPVDICFRTLNKGVHSVTRYHSEWVLLALSPDENVSLQVEKFSLTDRRTSGFLVYVLRPAWDPSRNVHVLLVTRRWDVQGQEGFEYPLHCDSTRKRKPSKKKGRDQEP